MKNKAIFADRDGVLIEEVGYPKSVNDIKFYPWTKSTIKILKNKGFKIFIVSNQSGIGRGIISDEASREIWKLFDKLVDDIAYCPHIPEDGCDCRKPNPKLIQDLVNRWDVDISRSYMIGDKYSDIVAGQRAGLTTILVDTGYGGKDDVGEIMPDHVIPSFKKIIGVVR